MPHLPHNITSQIVPLYQQGQTVKQIAKTLRISYRAVYRRIQKAGLKRSTDPRTEPFHTIYSVNEKYFEIVDTPEKAYWLGFFYADGCVQKKSITVSAATKDKEHMEQFKKDIGYTGPIHFSSSTEHVFNGRVVRGTGMYIVCINRKKLAQDLTKLGCVPAKSLILTFPTKEQVPSYLIHHFIRGVFDGDGCIYRGKYKHRNRYDVSFSGAKHLLAGIQDYFLTRGVNRVTVLAQQNIYKLAYGSVRGVKNIQSILYTDATRSLARKRLMFEECIQQPEFIRQYKGQRYLFQRSDGTELEIYNLRAFCRNNGLILSSMWDAIQNNRPYRGFKLLRRLNDSHENLSEAK